MPDFFIIAGEASGDLHASSLVRAISDICPDSKFSGIGGKEMRASGVNTIFDINEVNFIGFTSVVKNFSAIRRIMGLTVEAIRKQDPTVVILVDFPGFNLRIAQTIRKFYRGKIVYYIAPQVWAWHKSRIKSMKKMLDLLLVVFPFEVPFFKKEGMESAYVGHPLITRINSFLSGHKRLSSEKIRISLLPGSRKGEVESILPEMIKAAKLLDSKYDCEIKILCTPHLDEDYYKSFEGVEKFQLIHKPQDPDANYLSILNSELVITKSGTSTLECALIGTPFLVVYKTSPVNYFIGKNLVEVKYISIVNLLLDKPAVKEYLQQDMTTENILSEASRIIDDKDYSQKMQKEFKLLREILGSMNASQTAAMKICCLAGCNS
ncbi:MAG: lipid-A-disaccharide synthase [Ignavibacteria bacterium]